MGYNNTQKMMTSNQTHLTVVIADIIISEGLSFNISQKPRLQKVLDFEINVSKSYQPPYRKLIYKNLFDVIHYQNIESNLILIKKESDLFGLLFLCDGATISIIPLLNILVSGKIFQQPYQNLLVSRANQQMVGERIEVLYVLDFLSTLKN